MSCLQDMGLRRSFLGDTPVGDASVRQRILRPVKRLAVMLGVMPKTTAGKKWLKRVVFGGLVAMPGEIGPQITQITRINGRKKAQKAQKCPQGKQNGKDDKTLYRGRYVEPDRISATEPDKMHKVIYCVASLDPQITQIKAKIGHELHELHKVKREKEDNEFTGRNNYFKRPVGKEFGKSQQI